MAWIQPATTRPTHGRHLGLFGIEVMLALAAIAIATLLVCAIEARLDLVPAGFDVISGM